jgi:phage gp46-like protein
MGDLQEYRLEKIADSIGLLALEDPTTAIGSNVDDADAALSIGFDFDFDNTTYTTLTANTNGYVRLAGSLSSFDNTKLYTPYARVIFSPWWDDLKTSDVGYIKAETVGTAPDRRFVCEWRTFQYFNESATNKREIVFQVVLYETTNAIEFRYGDPTVVGVPGTTSSASVGVKRDSASGADANARDFFGSGHPFGGASKSLWNTTLSSVPGDDFPGDATNSQENERYYFRFSPLEKSLEISGADSITLDFSAGLPTPQSVDLIPAPNTSEFLDFAQIVEISLFSWARAETGDELPVASDGPRGFWGAQFGTNGNDNFGSRLWLLERSKDTPKNRERARMYASEALQWIRKEGLAESVSVELEETESGTVGFVVTITRGTPAVFTIPRLWERLNNAT